VLSRISAGREKSWNIDILQNPEFTEFCPDLSDLIVHEITGVVLFLETDLKYLIRRLFYAISHTKWLHQENDTPSIITHPARASRIPSPRQSDYKTADSG
jgi:K+ transporter